MDNIKYSYSEVDCFEFPQKYQMSEYGGSDFLLKYKKSRNKIITQINFKTEKIINEIHEIAQNYKNEYLKIDQGKTFKTEKILWFLYNKLSKTELNVEYKELINKFIKKFEINKKIFDVYESDLTTKSENFRCYRNYLILSFMCIKLYEKEMNLKYLNTSLKINDALCSINNKISDQFDLKLLKETLQLELKAIESLMEKKV